MRCQYCGNEQKRRGPCLNCGGKPSKRIWLKLVALLAVCVVGAVYLFVGTDVFKPDKQVLAGSLQAEKSFGVQEKEMYILSDDEEEVDLTEVIADAQETVYTIYSSVSQGSGFLYNDTGAVVTNAHVVEGAVDVTVKTADGAEYPGTVIGYSNQTDVALIDVPDLAGVAPSEMALDDDLEVGEEVIALGSPLDLEDTATMGYLTGKNRSFVLDPYVYEDVFQISATIAPGSSGGPLLSKDSTKVIGINSAKSLVEDSIGFSIPLFKVSGLIEEWLVSPMSEENILAQFYDANGDYYFGGLWEDGEGYFDGGEYSEDDSDYDYDSNWDDDSYEDSYEGYDGNDSSGDDGWSEDYNEGDDGTYWDDDVEDGSGNDGGGEDREDAEPEEGGTNDGESGADEETGPDNDGNNDADGEEENSGDEGEAGDGGEGPPADDSGDSEENQPENDSGNDKSTNDGSVNDEGA